jgi:hypothetical protein
MAESPKANSRSLGPECAPRDDNFRLMGIVIDGPSIGV